VSSKRSIATALNEASYAGRIAYAEAKGTDQAILVYPIRMSDSVDSLIGRIRVKSLIFSLDGEIEAAGNQFLDGIFS
jgi:5-methylcytosine-specific restriction enzyme subunit McrC